MKPDYAHSLYVRRTLIAHARGFHQRGWMLGTAGNLSAREGAAAFWVTASGCSKGELALADFVQVSVGGEVVCRYRADARPSAETSIHRAVYVRYPEARACYHVHSVPSNALSSGLAQGGMLTLPVIEMAKGFGYHGTAPVEIPVFANHAHVPDIAKDMAEYFADHTPAVPLALIAGHGVTVWANSQEQARNYVELAEYWFQYAFDTRR